MSADGQLVERIREGDQTAFRALVDRYKRPLYVMVRRMVGDHETCDDVLQESFLRLWRAAGALAETGSVFPYLRKIAVNQVITRRRYEKRRPAAALGDAVEFLADPGGAEEERGRELREQVAAAFGRLSAELRACLSLRVNEEMSYDEIAQTLDIPRGTVMSRLSRARSAVAALLGKGAES